MSTIAFAHHKGGTGKTTSCLNIAGFLQKADKRVLIIDCDPQANATSGLGLDPSAQEFNMYDVFMSFFDGFPDAYLEDIITTTESGIEIAPSSLDLVGVEPYLYNIDERSGILKEMLEPLTADYDHIFVDTPPSMGQFVINGLIAADQTIVTLDSGIFALKGIDALAMIFDDIEESTGRQIVADMAILTRWGPSVQPRSTIDSIAEWLKRLLNEESNSQNGTSERKRLAQVESEVKSIFKQVYAVPFDGKVYEAQQRGMPLSHYAPHCEAAEMYKQIADVIALW